MRKVELLAPCGSFDALIAAVNAGADAVYLGGANFGARAFSQNFTNEKIIEAIEYAHIRDVKVYVTVNTLIYEDELDEVIEYLRFLYNSQVDAIIIQDLGLLEIIERMFPDFEVHASTQMHIHNIDGVKFLKQQGVKRVVLARETPIELLKECAKIGVEIETFIYGALCICYSGQCLMSSVNGGRSGNRGQCAQPCRFKYSIFNEDIHQKVNTDGSYLLSTKDLNTLDNLPELLTSGITSLKIEGRMKRPEYVYEVVSTFRNAIDSYYENRLFEYNEESLLKLFNREFTKGYLFHEKKSNITNNFRPNHIGIPLGKVVSVKNDCITIKLVHDLHQNDGIRFLLNNDDVGLTVNKLLKNDLLVNSASKGEEITIQTSRKIPCKPNDMVVLTTDSIQISLINKELNSQTKKISISGLFSAKLNERLSLTLNDGKHKVTVYSNEIAERAQKHSITEQNIIETLSKIKDTPYVYSDLNIELEDNLFISLKTINELKRQAILELNRKRVAVVRIPNVYSYQIINSNFIIPEYSFDIVTASQKESLKDYGLLFSTNKQLIDNKVCYRKTYRANENTNVIDTNYALITQIADLNNINTNQILITDTSLNITNSYALEFLLKRGVNSVIASIECTNDQISEMIKGFTNRVGYKPSVGKFIFGKIEVMIMKHCVINKCMSSDSDNCNLCRSNQFSLIDQNNHKYLLTKDDLCHSIILTNKPFIELESNQLISFKFIKLYDENFEDIKECIK